MKPGHEEGGEGSKACACGGTEGKQSTQPCLCGPEALVIEARKERDAAGGSVCERGPATGRIRTYLDLLEVSGKLAQR